MLRTLHLWCRDRDFLGEAARILAPGGKYMLFSVFANDGVGHKDMKDILRHPNIEEEVEVGANTRVRQMLLASLGSGRTALCETHDRRGMARNGASMDSTLELCLLYMSIPTSILPPSPLPLPQER